MGLQDPCFSKKMKIYKSLGVTYVELLVTVAIIGIVSVLAIASYVGGEQRQKVTFAVHQIEQDIRRTQALSLAGKKDSTTADRPCGYGVKFILNSGSYTLFRELPIGTDCSDSGIRNKEYNTSAGEEIENGLVSLPADITVTSITKDAISAGDINIFYTVPFAQIFFDADSSATSEVNVQIRNKSGFTKNIVIKKSGEISIN